ncbi:ABC transporter substrate-binding protein [Oscillibacter sp.]|uniref:ABC transporter substrate-binding protein n=1 Tax=Oscillibacter sp. TaxID=1945593 RepID=UPI0033942C9B
MKHFKKVLISLLCAAMLLSGCSSVSDPDDEDLLPDQSGAESSASESAETPAVLPEELALPYYPGLSLDPITCPDGVQQTVAALLCEGLFELDETFAPQPLLCSSYTCDPTGTVYTFSLRSGVLFSDGSALTAADVADTLRRAQSSGRYGTRLNNVTSIAAGDGAVTVTLSAPNTGFPALLDIPIVKSETADSIPVGTGPYRFVPGSGAATLTANPNWQGGKQPVDHVALRAADDPDVMLFQFSSHETQLLTSDLTGSSPVSVTGSVQFYDADSTIFQYVGVNIASPALSDAAVRQALSLGIDRGQTVSAFLSGHAKAAQFPISPASKDYPGTLEKAYSYDAFQQAMTAAGRASGAEVSLRMIVNEESSFKVAAARQIASQLSAFDLKIDVSVLPWEEYTAALAAGNFDLYYGEVKLTADWDLHALLSTGGALNYGGYSDPTLDGLLTACRSSGSRSSALLAVCRRLQTQAPILPVCFKTVSVLVQRGTIENLTPTAANPFYKLAECTVHLQDS